MLHDSALYKFMIDIDIDIDHGTGPPTTSIGAPTKMIFCDLNQA